MRDLSRRRPGRTSRAPCAGCRGRLSTLRVAPAIRPASDPDLDSVLDVLRLAGFGTQVGRLLEFPRRSPHGTILVGARADTISGVAACASFGATGWIGALGVTPAARRAGLGTALTEEAVTWLREHGARTVLLYATEAGRPVYERLGFVAEGQATAWRGTARDRPSPLRRRLGAGDRELVRRVDRQTTGEARDAVLDAIRPLSGVGVAEPGDGGLLGWAVSSPWGAGTAIAATNPNAGVALMAAATHGPATGTLIFPDANRAAGDAVRSWRFLRLNEALRMRLGPPVPWCPERQFGLFNLFWG